MNQSSYAAIIADQTERALWEIKNVIDCVPDRLWEKDYCDAPLWKHIYHTLHSLDQWYINPRNPNFHEPGFHRPGLNNLDVSSEACLSRPVLCGYYDAVKDKIERYALSLHDADLLRKPEGCEYTRFTLILAQFRHLHTHMGILMGFIIAETGKWPWVAGLEHDIPVGETSIFF